VLTGPAAEDDEDAHRSAPQCRVIHTSDDLVGIGGHDDDVRESAPDGVEVECRATRGQQQPPRGPGVGQPVGRRRVDDEDVGAVELRRGRRRVGDDDHRKPAAAQHVVQPVGRFGIGGREHDSHPTYRMCVLLLPALIPVRMGPTAKRRLAHVLSAAERAALVRSLLDHVVAVLPVDVQGAEIWTDEAPGLNAAVAAALERLGPHALVVHADLPLLSAADVDAVLGAEGDVVIARSYDGGTNGLLMRSIIRPAFGVGSALMHADRARRAGLRAAVLDIPGFAMDVDDEVGLSACDGAGVSPYTRP